MTDSVHITLDLRKLPMEERRLVPVFLAIQTDQHGEAYGRHIRPVKLPSPLVRGAMMMWIVRAEESPTGELVATSIDADLNIPNALVGQNAQHGTSVFAAGMAALMLIKIWLAKVGLTRGSLDLLTVDEVSFRRATVTFLMDLGSEQAAYELLSDVQTTASILNKKTVCFDSTNKTVKYPTKAGMMLGYSKTVIDHCHWPSEEAKLHLTAECAQIVRLEAALARKWLEERGLSQLSAWRNAYRDGLYEFVFNEAVVAPLRLNLRHNFPRPEVFEALKSRPVVLAYLNWYLAGNDPRQFPNVLASDAPISANYRLRTEILAFDIDTNIPWVDHVRLRGHALRGQLVYPGDWAAWSNWEPWCFCKATWPALLARLYDALAAALSAAERRNKPDSLDWR